MCKLYPKTVAFNGLIIFHLRLFYIVFTHLFVYDVYQSFLFSLFLCANKYLHIDQIYFVKTRISFVM
jgi:hypothetical protein